MDYGTIIKLTLTDEQIQAIKPILDPHNEAEPDILDITNWIYNLIDTAIENSPGYY